jgi:hypothetical protein
MEEQDGDHQFFQHEKKLEKKFDVLAGNMSQQYLGKKDVPWL